MTVYGGGAKGEAAQHDQACLKFAVSTTLLLCYEIDPRETPAGDSFPSLSQLGLRSPKTLPSSYNDPQFKLCTLKSTCLVLRLFLVSPK